MEIRIFFAAEFTRILNKRLPGKVEGGEGASGDGSL